MKFILILFFSSINFVCLGQKLPITMETYQDWEKVVDAGLSDNGQYAYYIKYDRSKNEQIIIIKSLKNSWNREFIGMYDIKFTADNKFFIGKMPDDTLVIVNLVTKELTKISKIDNYDVYTKRENTTLIYFQNHERTITLRDLKKQAGRKNQKHPGLQDSAKF